LYEEKEEKREREEQERERRAGQNKEIRLTD